MPLIKDLSTFLEMSEADILKIVATAPRRYKIYGIPKRDGIGTRIIAQPAREVKAIQRYVIDAVLNTLPVHARATAYVAGKNIVDNAGPHLKSRVIMKLDFRDFFNSLVFQDLEEILREQRFDGIPEAEWRYLENILFWRRLATGRKCLSIGCAIITDGLEYNNGAFRSTIR